MFHFSHKPLVPVVKQPLSITPRLILLFLLLALPCKAFNFTNSQSRTDLSPKLSSEDQSFLEDLERRSFRYFWEEADPNTGLVPDRARTDGSSLDENHRSVASTAATGFG